MILIGADFVPTVSNYELFCSGDSKTLFGEELEALLLKADFRIFNLETPLCDMLSPIDKNGANFSAPTACVKGYGCIHTDLLTLANNHILDQGEQGLKSTLKVLEHNGIDTVGTGRNVGDAAVPYFFDVHSKRIGVYACAEHEFSIAGDDSAGANPFDVLNTPDHISALKAACDYVIVLYHGGKEYYRYPSPGLQKTCRKLIDSGADLVLCQHSHCVGCEEEYRSGRIIYGQGNFLFDNSDREEFRTSLLVAVDEDFRIGYIPLVKSGNGVRMASDEESRRIMDGFRIRSEEIKTDGFIKKKFEAFSEQMIDNYLMAMGGRQSLLFRVCNKLSGYRLRRMKLKKYGKAEMICLQNYFECESMREIIAEGLRQKTLK